MLPLKSDESLLLAAEARRKIWASQHPLSRVSICVSTTSEHAAHRADVDIFARPEVHVIHKLVEHHCTVGVDHSFQRLQLGLREHRTAVGVGITGVDVSIVQEAVHPLHDCPRGRPMRETATPRRAVAHELAAVAEQKGNLIAAETVIEVQGDGERAGVLIVHAPRRAPSADLRDGRAQGAREARGAQNTRRARAKLGGGRSCATTDLMHALRRGHATPRGVKCCAPGAGGLPANYLLNLVLNLTLNVLDLGKFTREG